MRSLAPISFVLLTALGCSTSSKVPGESEAGVPEVCNPEAPTECSDTTIRYADVQPIFEARCSECHGGTPGGPWPLDNYRHIADWAGEIRGQLLACTMPPVDAGVPITNEERERILLWIRCDAPE